MTPTTRPAGGAALLHTALGDFFVPEEGALHAEVRETGGHARAGLALLSSRLRPGDTVLDLGAGPGMLAVPLQRAVGSSGTVWCFVPDEAAAELLAGNLALNGVDLLTRVVGGDGWPHLDDWCTASGLARVDAIRAHGAEVAAALAADGSGTLARYLPLVLVTREFGARADAREDDPLTAALAHLGYSFLPDGGPSEAAADSRANPPGVGPASSGSMLALPPDRDAGGADE